MNGDGALFILSLMGVLFMGYLGIRRMQDRHAARKWPTTGGSVMSTTLEIQDRGEQSVHLATVKYAYTVDGERYTGAFSRSFMLHGRAEKWVARYPAGTGLVIRCNPGNPVESMVFENEQPAGQA